MQQSSSPHPASRFERPRFLAARPRQGARGIEPGRVLLGLVILAIGVLYLLQSFDVLDAGRTIDRWWPVMIIALGVLQFVTAARSVVGPLVVTAAGVLLLLASTDVLKDNAWSYVWPLVLVCAGASILLRRTQVGSPAGTDDDDTVRAMGIFGGPELNSTSQRFARASLTAVFGGVTLDLRGARPDPGGATVTATAAFGGIDIIVPHGWRIVTGGTPIFGAVADKTEAAGDLPTDAPVLRVDGLAIFGGIEIKHKK